VELVVAVATLVMALALLIEVVKEITIDEVSESQRPKSDMQPSPQKRGPSPLDDCQHM
jgi:hypothetical protein